MSGREEILPLTVDAIKLAEVVAGLCVAYERFGLALEQLEAVTGVKFRDQIGADFAEHTAALARARSEHPSEGGR